MKVLFVCNQGKHRSRMAAELFNEEFSTRYGGLYANEISEKDLGWADLVVVMEDIQRKELGKRFPAQYLGLKIVSLNIPDIYSYGQPELRSLLQERFRSPLVEL